MLVSSSRDRPMGQHTIRKLDEDVNGACACAPQSHGRRWKRKHRQLMAVHSRGRPGWRPHAQTPDSRGSERRRDQGFRAAAPQERHV